MHVVVEALGRLNGGLPLILNLGVLIGQVIRQDLCGFEEVEYHVWFSHDLQHWHWQALIIHISLASLRLNAGLNYPFCLLCFWLNLFIVLFLFYLLIKAIVSIILFSL